MLILEILFKPLNYLSKIVDSINHLVGIAVAWLTVLMVINVFVVVVLRYVFSIGFVWLQELYVWSHAAVFLLGAGYTLLHEGHVRIDVIYRKSSVSYKSIVNILGIIIFAIPLLYLIFEKSWPLISRSWENLERSAEAGGMPGVFILKSLIAVFAILFGLQFFSLLIKSLNDLLWGSNASNPQSEADLGGKNEP